MNPPSTSFGRWARRASPFWGFPAPAPTPRACHVFDAINFPHFTCWLLASNSTPSPLRTVLLCVPASQRDGLAPSAPPQRPIARLLLSGTTDSFLRGQDGQCHWTRCAGPGCPLLRKSWISVASFLTAVLGRFSLPDLRWRAWYSSLEPGWTNGTGGGSRYARSIMRSVRTASKRAKEELNRGACRATDVSRRARRDRDVW